MHGRSRSGHGRSRGKQAPEHGTQGARKDRIDQLVRHPSACSMSSRSGMDTAVRRERWDTRCTFAARGLQGAAPVKTCEVLGWRRPRLFCAAKAVVPQPLSEALAPERTSRHHFPTKPDSLRQPRHFAASGARHAFGGIRSCRTKRRPARATAPAPTAKLRQKAGEDRSMALELRFGLLTSGLAAWGGRERLKSERGVSTSPHLRRS